MQGHSPSPAHSERDNSFVHRFAGPSLSLSLSLSPLRSRCRFIFVLWEILVWWHILSNSHLAAVNWCIISGTSYWMQWFFHSFQNSFSTQPLTKITVHSEQWKAFSERSGHSGCFFNYFINSFGSCEFYTINSHKTHVWVVWVGVCVSGGGGCLGGGGGVFGWCGWVCRGFGSKMQ